MKVRTGFVSNSSSSSFIIQGYKISSTKIPKELKHDFYSIITKVKDLDYQVDDDDYYIGTIIMSAVDETCVAKLDIKPIETIKPKIENFLNDNKIQIDESNFGIFAGSAEN